MKIFFERFPSIPSESSGFLRKGKLLHHQHRFYEVCMGINVGFIGNETKDYLLC